MSFHESGNSAGRFVDPEGHKAIRRAAFRSVLRRRYIFVTYRDLVDRVVSYFIKRHSQFLRQRLDPATQTFLDPSAIQAGFERWLPEQVKGHSHWFRTTLFDHFGLDVCRAETTDDGLLLARHEPNTLVVVPIETLSSLREAVEAEYGREICAPLADDPAVAEAMARSPRPSAAMFRSLRLWPRRFAASARPPTSARTLATCPGFGGARRTNSETNPPLAPITP